MRLLLVELNRLRSRRAVVLIVLAAALLTALLAGTAAWDTRPFSAAEQDRAQAQAEAQAGDPKVQEDLADCQADPDAYFGPGSDPAVCERFLVPQGDDFLPRRSLDLGAVLDGRGLALTTLVTGLLVVVGATFAGSDWSTGSISNQLLFRPRRSRLWLTKAAAVLVGAAVVATVLIGGFWVYLTLVAETRGIGAGSELLERIRWTAARGIALATAGALGGYALGMLLRGTLATLGVLFVYTLAGEALVGALPLERASRFGPANNVFAWVQDGTRVFDPDVGCRTLPGPCESSYQLGLAHGAAYLGALLALAVVVSLLAFHRRDVE